MSFEIREGEIQVSPDPASADDARLAFIGRVRTPWSRGDCPKNLKQARERGGGARLEIAAPYRPGLAGLEAGRHVIVMYWMDRGRRDLIIQNPSHVPEPRGVFSIRSPVRPNPLALATVMITKVDLEAGVVEIDAIDCFDETPLVDIKPWLPTIDTPPGTLPDGA